MKKHIHHNIRIYGVVVNDAQAQICLSHTTCVPEESRKHSHLKYTTFMRIYNIHPEKRCDLLKNSFVY
jgi:hypothetical protein